MSRRCGRCDGDWNFANNDFDHRPTCSLFISGPDESRSTRPVEVAPAPIASLGVRRFYKAEKPAQIDPRTALEAAMEWIDGDGKGATHIIVLVGRDMPDAPGCAGTRFFQAGSYNHHGQMGLCLEGMHMIRDSGQS